MAKTNKTLLLLLLMGLLFSTSLFASHSKLDLGLDANASYMSMNFEAVSGGLKTTLDTNINLFLDAYFKRGIGMDILFGTNFKDIVKVGAGFAYTTSLSSSTDFRLGIGPYFEFLNKFAMGVFARFDFDFNLSSQLFLALGAEVDMRFLEVSNGKAEGMFDCTVIVPRFGVGFNF